MPIPPLAPASSLLWSFRGPSRALHLTTLAFFLSFVVWFDMAPFAPAIKGDLGLTDAQMVTLALCNLALTVPARVLVGAAARPRRAAPPLRRPPRRRRGAEHGLRACRARSRCSWPAACCSASSAPGSWSASAWCRSGSTPEDLGTAEGVYGGWGNFGSAAAALALPGVATLVAAGDGGWRWGDRRAPASSAAIYGVVYWFAVARPPRPGAGGGPTPPDGRAAPSRPAARCGGSSRCRCPVAGALGVVAWRIEAVGVLSHVRPRASRWAAVAAYLAVAGARWSLRTNAGVLGRRAGPSTVPVPLGGAPVARLRRHLRRRAGGRLAAARPSSPTRSGSQIGAASAAGSAFAFTNLVTRPGGGLVSDVTGQRRRWVRRRAGRAPRLSFALLALLDGRWPLPRRHRGGGAGVGVRAGRQRRRVRDGAAGAQAGRAGRSPGWPAPTGTSAASPSRRSCSSPTTTPRCCSSSSPASAVVGRRSVPVAARDAPVAPIGAPDVVARPTRPRRWSRARARRGLIGRWSRPPASSRPSARSRASGLDDYQPFDPPLTYTVPDGRVGAVRVLPRRQQLRRPRLRGAHP